MYDKVNLWIDRADAGEQYLHIAAHLDEAKEQTDLKTGETKVFGSLEGLKVIIHTGGLSLVGSLPKYLYGGNNIYPLNRHTTKEAIEKMSDNLHINVDAANVTQIEFGTAFVMAHPVSEYLNRLGAMPLLQRYHFEENTLYYKGRGKKQPKAFVFYDKKADAAAKGMTLPNGFEEANLLKYEMRLNGRLCQQLGTPELTASTLSEISFYRLLMKRYIESYFTIRKQKKIKTEGMEEIKTVSDAYDVFVARLISQSTQNEIGGFLDELKEAGVFADRKNYYRLKKKIEEVSAKANITVSDELIRELDDAVKNAGAYV